MAPKNAQTTSRGRDGRFIPIDAQERFWAKVIEGDHGYGTACWIWQGARSNGYGLFWHDGRQVGAHRFAYELIIGPIPAGLETDHLCRIPACVRPLHLELVTPQVNVRRSGNPFGVNARLEICRRGHAFTGMWRGRRTCRVCAALRQAGHRAQKLAR